MITRHHLILVLMCTLILGIAFYPSDSILLGMLAAGSCAGAVLPDIHMKKPKRNDLRIIAFYISRFTVIFCSPVLIRLCQAVNGMSLSPSDKRLSHSVPGIIIIGGMVAGISVVPVFLFRLAPVSPLLVALVAGVLAGLTFHLIQDSCTRKGFSPLFPFCAVKISGSIRPCDRADTRIPKYQVYHCSMTAVIFVLHPAEVLPQSASLLLSLSALIFCISMMVWFSNVRIETCCLHPENSLPGNRFQNLHK
jgi:hypothetical protein